MKRKEKQICRGSGTKRRSPRARGDFIISRRSITGTTVAWRRRAIKILARKVIQPIHQIVRYSCPIWCVRSMCMALSFQMCRTTISSDSNSIYKDAPAGEKVTSNPIEKYLDATFAPTALHPSEESRYNLNKPGDDSCSLTIDADTLHSAHTPDRTSPAFWQMRLFVVVLRQRPGLAFPLIALLLLPRSVLHHLLLMSLRGAGVSLLGFAGTPVPNPFSPSSPPRVASNQKNY